MTPADSLWLECAYFSAKSRTNIRARQGGFKRGDEHPENRQPWALCGRALNLHIVYRQNRRLASDLIGKAEV